MISEEEYYAELFNSCDHEWVALTDDFGCKKCGLMAHPNGDVTEFSVPRGKRYEEVVLGQPLPPLYRRTESGELEQIE